VPVAELVAAALVAEECTHRTKKERDHQRLAVPQRARCQTSLLTVNLPHPLLRERLPHRQRQGSSTLDRDRNDVRPLAVTPVSRFLQRGFGTLCRARPVDFALQVGHLRKSVAKGLEGLLQARVVGIACSKPQMKRAAG